MWPWSEIRRLRERLEREAERARFFNDRAVFLENIALKALREQAAAHKGIRRLVERVKKLKKAASL